MDMHVRGDWRWAAAAAGLIGLLVLGLAIVLRFAGLGAAANAAQLVSLAPLIAGVIGWARSRRRVQDPVDDRLVRLGELLRTIAYAQGLTGQDLRARLQGRDRNALDAYLRGTRRAPWDFVTAFLDLVAGDDRWRREVLEGQIRPVWEAASSGHELESGPGQKKPRVHDRRRAGHFNPRHLAVIAVGASIAIIGLGAAASIVPGLSHNSTWTYNLPGSVRYGPVVAGSSIFIGGSDGTVYALAAATGHLHWTMLLEAPSSPIRRLLAELSMSVVTTGWYMP